jgi:hypothetical protein
LVCNFCLDASKIDDENETDQDEKNIGKGPVIINAG